MTPPTTITVSGGLITAHFIEAMRGPAFGHPGVKPESFALPGKPAPRSPAELEGQIAAAFELLVEQWDGIHAEIGRMDAPTLRRRWLRHLWELLDFEPVYLRGDTVLNPGTGDELRFDLTYRGWEGDGPILHTVAPAQGLDAKPAGRERGPKGKPPHDMLQLFLNLSRTDRWAILTNGLSLRLLRDYHHTSTRGYVEFDLEGIFESRNLADFRALYRMCHASRFVTNERIPQGGYALSESTNQQIDEHLHPPAGAVSAEEDAESTNPPASQSTNVPVPQVTILESFHQDSQAAGVKVGEDLRGQVRAAIETLANGFLQGPLAARLAGQTERVADFYDEILHVIYRILFLLYAEQRAILPRRDAPLADLYREAYSLTALREHAAASATSVTDPAGDPYGDLWEGLLATFAMVARGAPALGVTAYNGMLFDPGRTPILNSALTHSPSPANERQMSGLEPLGGLGVEEEDRLKPQFQVSSEGMGLSNGALLLAIRYLTTVTREGSLQRISFADLGVEEVGSVYESLLDYHPRIAQAAEVIEGRPVAAGEFFLDPRGAQRKTSGSYYTHPRPVHELVKSALMPVLEERLLEAGNWKLEASARQAKSRTARSGLEASAGAGVQGEQPAKASSPELVASRDGERVRLPVAYADLTPELRQRLEAALLAIKVCDSAMGSGHFLIAANNALALELARIRTGDEFPPEAAVMAARRDVLAHCIYGVDLNPMAVELAKVSLWINAAVPDQPLNFLDHHLKCGNSLIGAPIPAGQRAPDQWCIPTEAFREKTGDDPEVAALIRKRNSRELEAWRNKAVQLPIFHLTVFEPGGAVYEVYQQVEALAEAQPNMARERYAAYLTDADTQRERLIADAWTAAFFWPLTPDAPEPPTQAIFARLHEEGPSALTDTQRAMVALLATEHRFFHWHLEFPGVFDEGQTAKDESPTSSAIRPSSGFTVLLGNPPWERLNLEEKLFFADSRPDIATANTTQRRRLLAQLEAEAPQIYQSYLRAKREADCSINFSLASGIFPFNSEARLNTYALFVGRARQLIATHGRVGLIVPSGIATDIPYKDLFAAILSRQELVSLYDFENRSGVFPDVDSRFKFCLLTLVGADQPSSKPEFAFFLHDFDDLQEPDRLFFLSEDDLQQINPLTRTCPVFRSRRDAKLATRIHRQVPTLFDAQEQPRTGWQQADFLIVFRSDSKSGLYRTKEQLIAEGFESNARMQFEKADVQYWPVYEAKLIHQFDHRYATYAGVALADRAKGHAAALSVTEKTVEQVVEPRYWTPDSAVHDAYKLRQWQRAWTVGYRDITNATNERTAIAAIMPYTGSAQPLNILVGIDATTALLWVSAMNSIPCDYVVRQKVGGTHLNITSCKQLPLPSPAVIPKALRERILAISVELTYTAWDLLPFARDILAEAGVAAWNRWFPGNPAGGSGDPAPFTWQEARRTQLRAELDAIYAHLYGLTAEELAYVLDTFPIVRRKDEAKWGEFRTKRLVLEAYDASEELVGVSTHSNNASKP